jgi:hypothetical protein
MSKTGLRVIWIVVFCLVASFSSREPVQRPSSQVTESYQIDGNGLPLRDSERRIFATIPDTECELHKDGSGKWILDKGSTLSDCVAAAIKSSPADHYQEWFWLNVPYGCGRDGSQKNSCRHLLKRG